MTAHPEAPTRSPVPEAVLPPVIVGCWQLSAGHRRTAPDREATLTALGQLADAGFDTFDCADIYTGVEALLGEFRARRVAERGRAAAEKIRVHTKLVPDRDDLARIDRRYVERIVDRSLRRLRVEQLDLVQFAWWNYSVPGYVEAAGHLDDLRRAGKVARIGVTNFDAERLREILEAGVPVATQQVQYSLLDPRPEGAMVDLCSEHGVRLLCYGTLAGGFLSRRYLAAAPPEPPLANRSLTKYRLMIDEAGGWSRFQGLLQILANVSERLGREIAQVAVAWVLSRPTVASALVGISDPSRLAGIRDAADLSLPAEELGRLEAWRSAGPSPAGSVFGLERDRDGRHGAIMKYNLNREGGGSA